MSPVKVSLSNLDHVKRTRETIGIYVDNCFPDKWRNSVIDALLASGLPVESYGACRHTHGAPNERHARDMRCREHRMMLAVENAACPGWISPNLAHAVSYGALPIVRSLGNQPGYGRFLHKYPHVDVAREGWLDQVRHIMLNDTYFTELMTRWHVNSKLDAERNASHAERSAWFHCQWWDQRPHAAQSAHRREWIPGLSEDNASSWTAWTPCAYAPTPDDHRSL